MGEAEHGAVRSLTTSIAELMALSAHFLGPGRVFKSVPPNTVVIGFSATLRPRVGDAVSLRRDARVLHAGLPPRTGRSHPGLSPGMA